MLPIIRDEWNGMTNRARRDPKVVVWNRLADPSQFGFEIAIEFCCSLVRQEQSHGPQKGADLGEGFLWSNCSLCAETEFPENYPGHMEVGNLGEARRQ